MFHTMQAMCILYTSHSKQAEIAVAYPSLWQNKKNQWVFFLEFWHLPPSPNSYLKPKFYFLD